MDNRKHIDRLFQEKFKDFEVTPDSKVWKNIQHEIAPEKRQKKRIMPIWFKYGSIAALLLLFFAIGINAYKTNTSNDNDADIVDIKPQTKNETPILSNINIDNTIEKTNNESKKITKEDNEIELSKTISTHIVNHNKSKSNIYKNNSSFPINNNKGSTVVATNSIVKKSIPTITHNSKNETNLIAEQKNNPNTPKDNSALIARMLKSGVAIISNSNVQKTSNEEEEINNAIDALKDDAFSTVLTEEGLKGVEKDSTTNTIEIAVSEAEKKYKKRKNNKEEIALNKWTINANIAPVYYNSIGKGSHIDEQFIDNKKTGTIKSSYGINVGYAINKKLKVRSGINSLNLGYNTENVVIYESITSPTPVTNTLNNLEMSTLKTNGIEIAVISGETININQIVESFVNEDFKTAHLKQEISYTEIPIELEYAIINKRIGVNVIGGMSTFILSDNEVSTELKGVTTTVGKVNNINPVSFSTNIGIGMNYGFSKSLQINLEPTFKYQLNAFNDTSGNFNPYLLGVYTGLRYKF